MRRARHKLILVILAALFALSGCGADGGSITDAGGGDQDDGSITDAGGDQTDGSTTDAGGDQADGSITDAGGDQADGSITDAGGDQADGSITDAGGDDQADGSITDAGGDDQADGSITDAGGDDPADAGGPVENPNEIIADRHFARGFTLMHPDTGDLLGDMSPAFETGDPKWHLAQWGSLASLDGVTPSTLTSGAMLWENTYAAVTIGPIGSGEADLSFLVNAYDEYGGVYRSPTDSRTWIHLLGAQRISPPDAQGPGCPALSQLNSLVFSVDCRLISDVQNIHGGYDPSRHNAAYLIYFTIQNLGSDPEFGYGDYLWFGLTLYDDRNDMPGLYVNGDDATGKLIYNIGLAPLSDASLADEAWHRLHEDLLPHILDALQEAWDRGYLPHSHNLSDYYIGGMNLGWEIPGLNNAELQIRNLSLVYADNNPTEIRYDFNTDGDREGWTTANIDDPNDGPIGGTWTMSIPGSDPVLLSPALQINAANYGSISVTMANDGNPADDSHMQIFWSLSANPGFIEDNSDWIPISNAGGWATYTIDLSAHPYWNGAINQIRIDPIMSGDGNSIGIDAIVITP
ncbi:MAG: hypothetical protein JRF33_10420 [Deltaproteobacteria bacterium]|nr:hypothetical protein [Deltaproteobacteria bacterium]